MPMGLWVSNESLLYLVCKTVHCPSYSAIALRDGCVFDLVNRNVHGDGT